MFPFSQPFTRTDVCFMTCAFCLAYICLARPHSLTNDKLTVLRILSSQKQLAIGEYCEYTLVFTKSKFLIFVFYRRTGEHVVVIIYKMMLKSRVPCEIKVKIYSKWHFKKKSGHSASFVIYCSVDNGF